MDINKASSEELEQAFQVDGVRARRLVDRRKASGPFKSWDEIKSVPGFEDKMLENLRAAGLTIGPGHDQAEPGHRTTPDSGARATGSRGLDINTVSAEELQSIFELDSERASYLVSARQRLGVSSRGMKWKREAEF